MSIYYSHLFTKNFYFCFYFKFFSNNWFFYWIFIVILILYLIEKTKRFSFSNISSWLLHRLSNVFRICFFPKSPLHFCITRDLLSSIWWLCLYVPCFCLQKIFEPPLALWRYFLLNIQLISRIFLLCCHISWYHKCPQ